MQSVLGTHAVVDRKVVLASEAVLPVQDAELQYGFGVYESLRVIKGGVVYEHDHLDRLMFSANGVGLEHSYTVEELHDLLAQLLRADSITEATVRILLMGGKGGRLFMTASPMLSYPATHYTAGIATTSYHGERFLPQYKTCSLFMNYLALREARQAGAFEALLVDSNGAILEGTRSNFFACEGNTIYTADDSQVLSGVTRDKILHAIAVLGYTLCMEAPRLADVLGGRFQEVFISSTSMGAMPVKQVDGALCQPPFERTQSSPRLIRQWEVDALP